jgi:DUF3035 family protein
MKAIARIAVVSTLCLTLLACSETTVMNKMGLGKAAPDETSVVRNNNLSMPPDLQLRPPSATAASEAQAAPSTVAAVPATPPDAFATPPVETANTTQVATAEASPYDTGEQQLQTDGSSTAATTAVQPTPAVQSTQKRDLSGVTTREDAYLKFGISKTRPDGTAKTQTELDRELLEAVRREKRKQNPSYGTIFNMGDLFRRN